MVKKSGKGFSFQGNILIMTLMRLLVVLVLLFLSRIVFFFFNFSYFSGAGFSELMKIFFYGLRFDISGAIIINAPYIFFNSIPFKFRFNKVYQGFNNAYFYIINSIGLMSNFSDMIYFRFTLKRVTADLFNYLGVGGDFDRLVPQFLQDFWYVALIWIFFIALLIFFSTRFKLQASGGKGNKGSNFKYYFLHGFLFLLVIFISIVGIRGGFQLRPISLITAGNYTSAKNIPLILNTPFSIAKTVGKESLKTVRFYSKESDLSSIYTPLHKGGTGPFKKLNVMIIIMESFSLEHIGALNKDIDEGRYQGFTPFIDSLIGQSLTFKAFANGKTSIQGIPAILSSIPSLMNESFIQSNYAADKTNSLANLLKPKGYSSAFFHGGTNGTMGFDSYTKSVGFEYYYGRSEYGNEKDYDGKWGIRDEEFFQYTAGIMNKLPQPFLVSVFSLSSHHPYHVPAKYSHKFRKGNLPIQESIMYADYSLKRFFETVQKLPWFENTLFVITADHTSEGYLPYYQSSAGQYAIPVVFYKRNSDLKGLPDEIVEQTDIMPSVLGFLGYDKDYIAFGTDLFDPKTARFSIHYISGLYGLLMDGYSIEFDGTHSTALYDLKRDKMQRNNLIRKETAVREKMERFIRAYIQQYNNRVIENRLTAD